MKKKSLKNFSAYHGGSWKNRTLNHSQERKLKNTWSASGINSEYLKLKKIALFKNPQKLPVIKSPEKVQHLEKLNWNKLNQELLAIKKVFNNFGVNVVELPVDFFSPCLPNLMFLRDQFLNTPWGAILGRMGSAVRAGEEKWVQLLLAQQGIPIIGFIQGSGTFEGADALWLNKNTLMIGTGNRTNTEGFRQIRDRLKSYAVKCIEVKLSKSTQHLLGALQIVSKNQALVRVELVSKKLLTILKKHDFNILRVSETHEVTHLQAMNLVTLKPNAVIMAANCPDFKRFLLSHKIKVLAEVPISEFIHAAGGLACSIGILERDWA